MILGSLAPSTMAIHSMEATMKRLAAGIAAATGIAAIVLFSGMGRTQPADFMTICQITLFHGQERCACMDEYLTTYLDAGQYTALRALLSAPKDSTRENDTKDKDFLDDAFEKAGLFCESHNEARIRIQREKAERQDLIDTKVRYFLPGFVCSVTLEYARGLLTGAWSDASEYVPAKSPLTLAGCTAAIANANGAITVIITQLPPDMKIDLSTVSTDSKLKMFHLD